MKLIRNGLALLPMVMLMANVSAPSIKKSKTIPEKTAVFNIEKKPVLDAYAAWDFSAAGLSKDVFYSAVKGYNYLLQKNLIKNTDVLTIIDYSKSSSQKRLYVLDMNSGKILFNTLAAHGKNSGMDYATDFSNEESSNKTSLGFFITSNTYMGNNGYSLRLQGCEKGINNRAMERAIVMHGAGYVNENFVQSNGYLGRSHGCPAVPQQISKSIIDVIKNGSCLFLYHPTKKYTTASKILNSQD
jgi:L,D-transpeptidase catalytic domain